MTTRPQITPPDGLTSDALDLFEDVTAERGDTMSPEQFAALIQACRLVSLADRAEEHIGDAWVIAGYRGQMIANPLIGEARMARAAAVTALKAAGLAPSGAASASAAALANRRWHGPRRTA
jgi:hypothetical protein